MLQLCAGGTFGQFCRACRRRPNLTVGYAALWQRDVHMARRDGDCRNPVRRNSNIVPRADQIAVSYGSQLFVRFGVKNSIYSGSNHGIAKTRRQNLDLICSFIHAKPQLPENFLSKV